MRSVYMKSTRLNNNDRTGYPSPRGAVKKNHEIEGHKANAGSLHLRWSGEWADQFPFQENQRRLKPLLTAPPAS